MKKLKEKIKSLSYKTRELLEYPMPLHEASSEYANSIDKVIYTAKARENVASASQDELAEAEMTAHEMGGVTGENNDGTGLWGSTATLLSYHIEESRYRKLIQKELGDIKSLIDYPETEEEEIEAETETILEAINIILGDDN